MWVADSNTLRFLLSSKQQFEEQRIDEQFAFGLYYGASIALIVLSLLLWLSLKTPLFLVYGLYLVSNTMLWFSLNGFAFQHFWPNSPQCTTTAFISSSCCLSCLLSSSANISLIFAKRHPGCGAI
ncbi:hypothetical protein MPL1_08052 [Methylophaga lonarensis MPL]|uniref:7TM-DISM receptor extracellular domain-containing protein n=2 Tax=Methylophaga lonarensis TaxID=999151 RepID=M7P0B1_9GAMM|nr:hypothetical protein MPL1_08052 [Methylophaga lonarensis MPL]